MDACVCFCHDSHDVVRTVLMIPFKHFFDRNHCNPLELCLDDEVQYSRDERFFAFKRFAVIVVIMVADVIFISTSHMVLLLFKAFRAGDLGTPEAPVRALVEVAFLLGFMQGPGGEQIWRSFCVCHIRHTAYICIGYINAYSLQ